MKLIFLFVLKEFECERVQVQQRKLERYCRVEIDTNQVQSQVLDVRSEELSSSAVLRHMAQTIQSDSS